MWRALFLGLGIFTAILGAEGLVVDRAVLKPWVTDGTREIAPEPWIPWMLLSAGAVVVLYSFTIPRRAKE
jgi:hypothetical protein